MSHEISEPNARPVTSADVASRPGSGADVERLTAVALVAAIHFVVSYVSLLINTILFALLGPYSIFFSGVFDQGVQALLLAVVLVLFPRVGTASLQMATVFLLNGVFSASLNISSLVLISGSIALHEAILWLAGVTRLPALREARPAPSGSIIVRVAVSIGLCKAITVLVQYLISMTLYRLQFSPSFIAAVTLATLVYAAVGGAAGVPLGYHLRRASP
ncbi:MAG: hypothetical protein JSS27_17300 [Planctomycetes bacterium]|nr:hypothetical protein [Planctomycetota bacterium]